MDHSSPAVAASAIVPPAEQVIGLLARLLTPVGDGAPARRALLDGVAALIDADAWIWVLTRTPAADLPATLSGPLPTVVLRLDGGLSSEQRDVLLANQRSPYRGTIANAVLPEVFATGRATRRRIDLFTDAAWHANPFRRECVRPLGFDEFVIALRRTGPAEMSTAIFYRNHGRPGFDEAQCHTLALVADHAGWLHRVGDIDAAALATVDLTPRERQVLQCLIAGQSRKQIAEKLGIKPYTVSDYQKRIYRRFAVKSRGELQAKFLSGQAGPTAAFDGSPGAKRGSFRPATA